MEVKFIVNGEPMGKMRHRIKILRNGMVHSYNDEKNTIYEELVQYEYKRQCHNIYFTGELEMVINAYYGIPKSFGKIKREQALNGEIRPQTKPDIDNCTKIILDSLNKVAYDDDKAVVDLIAHKYYSENPRVEVVIIGNVNLDELDKFKIL